MTSIPLDKLAADDAPHRSPPITAIGPLGWMRKNFFSSAQDTILTIVGVGLVISVISSLITWVITDANWFAITFNLRLYLLGRYESFAEWRVIAWVLIVAFSIGIAFAAWGRLRREVILAVGSVLTLLFILPPIINAVLPAAVSYTAAGNMPIVSGSETLTPQQSVAFTGIAGERISLRFASDQTGNDEQLAELAGFADRASNQLLNAAADRLGTMGRIVQIQSDLSGDLLTANQRTRLEIELGKLQLTDPVSTTYTLNQNPVQVRVLRGTSGAVIGEATLEAASAPLELVLPEDGWYVLEKLVSQNSAGIVLLQAQGIFPVLQRTVNRAGDSETVNASADTQRIDQYTRMNDFFTTEEPRPRAGDTDVPIVVINDNQYRGTRPLSDYLTLFVGPFFVQIRIGLLGIFLAVLAGYFAGQFLSRISPTENPRHNARRAARWLLVGIPILMFILIYGIGNLLPLTNTSRWGGLLLTVMLAIVGIIASFPLGILLALGRRSQLPAISLFSTTFIEVVRGVPFITVLFMSQLLVPLVNPALGETPPVFRAMVGMVLFTSAYLAENIRGGLQAVSPGQIEAAKALGLNGLQITLNITLPQALRIVIPALVGMFISLFIDTSLVVTVGLLELLGISNNVVVQTEFIGTRREIYLFVLLIYFSFTYTMTLISRRIEASGAGRTISQKI